MNTKVFAHYLPQFHRIKENSEWWSPGFTEWTNVSKARELFPGHYQPHIPADLGFYDLSSVDIMYEQAELAKGNGIDGFNFYFYWFDGRRILEKPLENFLSSDVQIEFSLCWANENWTRRWDGADKEVLLEQSYKSGFEVELFADLLPYFEDPRYLRIEGKPVISIYRAQEIPNVKMVFENLRKLAVTSDLPGLHIVAVESFGLESPGLVGADAMMEFPPHGVGASCIVSPPAGIQEGFVGQAMDYRWVVKNAAEKPDRDFTYYRGLMPGWDNTARTGNRAHFFVNSSPRAFRSWLDFAVSWTMENFSAKEQGLVFINAWNEWAEGAHLEPDLKFGHDFLNEVREARSSDHVELASARRAINRLVSSQSETEPRSEGQSEKSSWAHLIKAFLREVNSNNLKQVLRLVREDPSGRKLFRNSEQAIKAILRVSGKDWRPSEYLDESRVQKIDWGHRVLFTCHIHYPEYLDRFSRLVETYSGSSHFAVTTDNKEVFEEIQSRDYPNVTVKKSQNRGRNFGPLLVELLEEMAGYDYVVHLHSKRSVHSTRDVASRWADLHWKMLGENKRVFDRSVALLDSDKEIAIAYPLATKVVKPSRFNWFLNRDLAEVWMKRKGIDFVEDPFPFPAGGMFLMRTKAFAHVLEDSWTYENFPEESGQLDGTTQHMLERLMGALPTSLGYKHLIYDSRVDRFTTDSSYARKYLGE